eukprot:1804605-Ditylum_brightwellii.AAC.1
MVHKTNQENGSRDGTFHYSFNPGPQAEEHGWKEANNKKLAAKGTKTHKRKPPRYKATSTK